MSDGGLGLPDIGTDNVYRGKVDKTGLQRRIHYHVLE